MLLRGLHHPKKKKKKKRSCAKTQRSNWAMKQLQGVHLVGLFNIAEWALQSSFPWDCNMRKPYSISLTFQPRRTVKKNAIPVDAKRERYKTMTPKAQLAC